MGVGGWAGGQEGSHHPEITPMVGHDVGVPTSFQDDFLLKGGNIIVCEEGAEEKATAGMEYGGVPGSQEVGQGNEDLGALLHQAPSSPSSITQVPVPCHIPSLVREVGRCRQAPFARGLPQHP